MEWLSIIEVASVIVLAGIALKYATKALKIIATIIGIGMIGTILINTFF